MFHRFRSPLVLTVVLLTLVGPVQAAPDVPNAPGDLDLTFAGFGAGGKVITTGVPMPPPESPDAEHDQRDVALQPDGKIVVAGYTGIFLLVMRYLPNGVLDTTFSGDGIATVMNPQFAVRGTSVALQADGKIVVAGWADTSPADFLVARLNVTGELDLTFGGDGYVTTDFDGDTDQAYAVQIQTDGKIVACGRSLIGADYDFAVARYNPDGSLDTTFAGDGKGSVGFGGGEACFDLALQEDGKLVLVGGDIGVAFFDSDFEIARLNSDGTPDSSFDGDGELTTGFGNNFEAAHAVAIQPDGKIVVAGDNSLAIHVPEGTHALVARYGSDGALDDSFDGDGKRSIDGLSGGIRDLALQSDGKILLLGWHVSPDGDYQSAFYRLNANGALDSTFDGDGDAFIDLGGYDFGHALALQADGRIIAYGSTGNNHVLIRLWPDGSLDGGGQQTLGFEEAAVGLGSNETAYGVARQGDGKLIVVGEVLNPDSMESDMALARFLPDGLPDTSFGDQGRVQYGFGQEDSARGVALQIDGKIVVAGYTDPSGSVAKNFMVARFNSDGSEDGTFGFGGFNVVDFMGGEDYGSAPALAPDGKVVVAGTVFNGARFVFGVARFNIDGTLDTSFDTDGKQLVEFVVGLTHTANAVVVQPDGKIVVAGTVGGDFALLRLNADGSLDGTFGLSGLTRTDMGGEDTLNALMRLPDGGFVAAGTRTISGNSDFALAQYTPNGNLVGCPPFPCSTWPSGKAFVDWGLADTAYALDWRSDGYVVAAGCAEGQFAWAQLRTNTLAGGTLKATTDFVGAGECASGVKFVGANKIVAAGSQEFNDDKNFALARFETTVLPDATITGLAVTNDSPTSLGQATIFTATITGGTNITYQWNFGDATSLTLGASVSHLYATSGVYTAVVTATNSINTMVANTVVTINAPEYDVYLPLVLR